MSSQPNCKIQLEFVGPPLEEGDMPAVVYLSLSAHDSLYLDPFNQFVKALEDEPLRVYSFTIPGHGPGQAKEKAIEYWAERFAAGEDVLTPFIDGVAEAIRRLPATKVALAGLSRGAFLALHIASQLEEVESVLGFAPLIDLERSMELRTLAGNPLVQRLALNPEAVCKKHLRFYIGNRDQRVGTDRLFSFVARAADAAYEKRVRASPIEMIVGPSLGYQGHGTARHTFEEGAKWIAQKLL